MRLSSLLVSSAALATAATAAAIAMPAASSAAEPTRETVQLTRQIPMFATCDGFVVRATFELTREITTFTDGAGIPVRRQIHVTADGVLSNAATGYSLVSNGVRNFSYDLVALTSFSTGSNTVIHLPGGGGSITLGTGRLQFDDTGQLVGYNGPTDNGPIGYREYDDLCAALS